MGLIFLLDCDIHAICPGSSNPWSLDQQLGPTTFRPSVFPCFETWIVVLAVQNYFCYIVSAKPVLTPIKEIDAALKACTFGIFQIRLLAITFVAYVSACLISSTTGYLLPVAECDLHMTLLQKGLLNAIPYTGQYIQFFLLYIIQY